MVERNGGKHMEPEKAFHYSITLLGGFSLKESEVKDYRFIQAKKLRWKFILKEENDW